MKIKNVRLENFRNISSADITLGRTNWILGPNNAGKSSVIAGMQYAVTDSSPFSGKITELQKQVPEDGSYPGVLAEAEIEGVGLISRYRKTGDQINRLGGTVLPDSEVEKRLAEITGTDYGTAALMFEGGRFMSMPEKEQKAFLLRLTGTSLPGDRLAAYLQDPTDAAADYVKKFVEQNGHTETLSDGTERKVLSIDDLEDAYRTFFAERREEKKKLAEAESTLKFKKQSLPAEKPRLAEYIGRDLEAAKEMQQKLHDYASAVKERTLMKQKTAAAIERGKQAADEAAAKIDTSVDVSPEHESELNAVLKETEIAEAGDSREKGACEKTAETFASMRKKLNTAVCPLSDRLVCKADKTPLIAEFDAKIKENTERAAVLGENLAAMAKKKAEVRAKLAAIAEQRRYRAAADAADKALADARKLASSVRMPAEPKGLVPQEEADRMLASAEAEKRAADSYNALSALIETLGKEYADEQERVRMLEYLVAEFSPKTGVRTRILKKIIAPLQDSASEMMGKLSDGYSVSFGVEGDGFTVDVTTPNGTFPYRLLSESEKLRARIVIQNVINSLTGAGILAVDEAGILDAKNFGRLADLLTETGEAYGTVVAAATAEKDAAEKFASSEKKKKRGTKIFWVENGTVTEL